MMPVAASAPARARRANPIAGVSTVARLAARERELARALVSAHRGLTERHAAASARKLGALAEHYPEAAALTSSSRRAQHFSEAQELAWQLRFAAEPLDVAALARRMPNMGAN